MAVFPIQKTPLIVPGCFIWLDAADPAGNGGRPANGSSLINWVDKSGRGNTFTQGTGALQPIFELNQQATLPAVRFSGFRMTCANSTANQFASNQNISVFAVVKNTNPTEAQDNFIIAKGFFPSGGWGAYSEQSTGKYSFVASNVAQYTSTANAFGSSTFEVFSALFDSAGTTTFYKNGANSNPISGSAGSNSNTQQLTLGTDGNLVRNWPGSIAELIVYNVNVGATNAATINSYLRNKWGIA